MTPTPSLQLGDDPQTGGHLEEGASRRRPGRAFDDSHDEREAVELTQPGEVLVDLTEAK
jgi:hypothetical protein